MPPLRALARSAAVLRGPRAREGAVLWALAGLVLLVIFGPVLLEYRRQAVAPGIYNSDVRQQIDPFFRYEDRSLFPDDLAADYYLACLPIGYRTVYAAAALGPGAYRGFTRASTQRLFREARLETAGRWTTPVPWEHVLPAFLGGFARRPVEGIGPPTGAAVVQPLRLPAPVR